MNELAISLAYKYVATALMLAEANYSAEHLHLRINRPIQQTHIQQAYVSPPRLLCSLGSLDTAEYSFGFGESGRLRFITRLHPFGDQPLPQLQRRLAKIAANMTTNAAYQLATNGLARVSVDLNALEHQYQGKVRQHFYHGKGETRVMLPIFDAIWGSEDRPAVIVTIYGPTGDLLQLRQNDESFSKRPARSLQNVESLLSIRDDEFRTYSPTARSNLVVRFSAATDSTPPTNTVPQPPP